MPNEIETADLLRQAGLSDGFIQRHLGIVVEKTLSPADTQIADKVRNFISECLDEALWTVRFGAPQDRVGLLKIGVANAARLLGQEGTASYNTFYDEWESLTADVRNIENVTLKDEDVIDILEGAE